MDNNAKEKLSELGFEYKKSEEHCSVRYRKGRLIVWKNLSTPGYCLAYNDQKGMSILMRSNIEIICEEIKSLIRDSRIDEVLNKTKE